MLPLKEKIYFVAGVGTDIGKTFFVEKICQNLVQKNVKVDAIKPISSGFSDEDLMSDYGRIFTALNSQKSAKIAAKNLLEKINQISPWRFKEPVSPHFAAKNQSQEINFVEVRDFCLKRISGAQEAQSYLFVEGAGGLMTPINFEKNFLDLASELKIPMLLVSANYLGAISHTLTALEAAKRNNVEVEAIVVNSTLQLEGMKFSGQEINQTLEAFAKVKVLNFQDFFAAE